MVPSAYLRAFLPFGALVEFDVEALRPGGGRDGRRWRQHADGPLGVLVPEEPFLGWRLDSPEGPLGCPAQVELRSLVGMLAVRDQYPDPLAEGFVTSELAGEAALQLETLRRDGRLRSHVLQARWQVPLRWFVPFSDEERDYDPSGPRLTYVTDVVTAAERIAEAVEAAVAAGLDPDLVEHIQDLGAWLDDFEEIDARLQLDYGGLAGVIPATELAADHSAADVWASIRALEEGDWVRAGASYMRVNERWAGVRALEVAS